MPFWAMYRLTMTPGSRMAATAPGKLKGSHAGSPTMSTIPTVGSRVGNSVATSIHQTTSSPPVTMLIMPSQRINCVPMLPSAVCPVLV